MLENKNTNNLEESFELNINEQESSSKKDLINYQDESPFNNSFNKINKSFLASSSSKSLTRVNDDYKNISRKFQLLSMEKIPKKKLNNIGRKEEENQDYIKILGRKSFAGNYQNKKPNFKELKENDMPNSDGVGGDKQNLIYPVNIFHEFLFSWTVRLFRIALRFGQLKIKHLGKFAQELSPTVFLKEILEKWEKYYHNNKSKILLKTLISSNICSLIIICFIGIIVTFLDILTIIFYRQILLHFDIKHYNKEDIMDQIYYPLLSTTVIMLFSKLFHIFLLRYFQFLTMKVGAKIIIQINTLIYNKLLKISPYASISEGDLVNYIQLDAENFGEFFSFTPAIIVLIIKIIFCIYLLFTYFGLTIIFGLISLIIILALFLFEVFSS